ncbi:MAG: hypothetical protein RR945_11970 [Erysipelotrichaceae bacterium]
MLNKKIKTIIISSSLAITLSIGSYYTFNAFINNAENDKDNVSIIVSKDFPLTSDLNKMADESDIIVIGEYESFDSKWNMARNPDNPTLEDADNYVEGHLYNFNVSEVVKGSSDINSIKVNHRFAETIKIEDSNELTDSYGIIKKEATKTTSKNVENIDPLYIKPTTGEKYMLFLKKDQLFENYYGAIEPFSIVFDENDLAELQTNIADINEDSLSSKVNINDKTFLVKNEIYETINDNISGMNLNDLINRIKTNN